MSSRSRATGRTLVSTALATALVAPTTWAAFTPAEAARPAAGTSSAASTVSAAAAHTIDDAVFTWGISGYAQTGIFGPWRIFDLAGDATLLQGSVSGGTQTDYAVEPIPATSMTASTPQKTPNAVRFSAGDGTVDPATGAGDLEWSGSYTVNPYPAIYGAPDEIYSDPALSVEADGSGELTMEVTIAAGTDMNGNPTDPVDLGRVDVMTFASGGLSGDTGADGDASYRVAPDYQGVTYDPPEGESAQTRECSTDNGNTGWWGAWPAELVSGMAPSVRPHYYSTSCGGLQDRKPPLPFDVAYTPVAPDPAVALSADTAAPDGSGQITVTGTDFDPALATGTRPPLAGKPAGVYVVFGKFAQNWRPSQGATSTARPIAAQKWAVKAEDMASIGGTAGGAVELTAAGGFTAALPIDKALADQRAADAGVTDGRYGIYTYAGSGAVQAAYETFTPVNFSAAPTVSLKAPTSRQAGAAFDTTITVSTPAGWGTSTGRVRLFSGGQAIGAADLESGRAVIPTSLTAVGERTLNARYLGSDVLEPSSAQATVTVIKAKSRLTTALQNGPVTSADRAAYLVSVANPYDGSLAVTGAVRVLEGERVLVRRTTLAEDGTASLTLPRLTTGQHQVRFEYLGSNRQQTAAKEVGLRVR